MITLTTPIEELTKVGKTVASRLKYLGIFNVFDLLNYYPFRYDDFSQLKKIKDLQPGDITTVRGKIELLANKRSFKKKMIITECFLSDDTGSIKAVWFAQPFIAKILKNGDEVYLAGKVDGDLFNHFLKNPSYEKAS
ncbi:MAG: DNA helicase RecG, partial [bacterium]|nr:DNA helicase RecG [bacterium]